MATETLLKIRNPRTGLYSTGGTTPRWTKKGKVWRGVGPLKNHLNLIRGRVYEGCEVVEFEMHIEEADTYPVQALLDAHRAKREEVERARKERIAKRKEAVERAQLRHLLHKYGDDR